MTVTVTVANVILWGTRIGAVSWDASRGYASFQYDADFLRSRIDVSPILMPLSPEVISFPSLSRETFHGLPGLLADSLPDRFGNALIDTWLATQGREADSFNPVERLCYIGQRATGGLEFEPAVGPAVAGSSPLDIDALVKLASEVLTRRGNLRASLKSEKRAKGLIDILRVGTSAGGARAKAVIAWNPKTNDVRSGQIPAGNGYSYWILKFDGVAGNKDKELDDPQGYGLIEYAYHLMAREAGVEMTECRLLDESGRHHFMTKRFDRSDSGTKFHMQSLGGLAHYDFNQAGAHSYEQALRVARRLELGMAAIEQLFRRALFNIVARNQDDHVKNISFLMDRSGTWTLAPAYDVTYSFNPDGRWTLYHQMSLNGKRDHFDPNDFIACAKTASMKRGRATEILDEVQRAVKRWPKFAARAGVPDGVAKTIASTHRRIE